MHAGKFVGWYQKYFQILVDIVGFFVCLFFVIIITVVVGVFCFLVLFCFLFVIQRAKDLYRASSFLS